MGAPIEVIFFHISFPNVIPTNSEQSYSDREFNSAQHCCLQISEKAINPPLKIAGLDGLNYFPSSPIETHVNSQWAHWGENAGICLGITFFPLGQCLRAL